MESYENIVKRYRKEESGTVLTNISVSHAKILFENLLEAASDKKEEVRIYSGTLSNDFYNQLTEAVKDTLKKSRVLVAVGKPREQNQVEGNTFADAVKNSDNGELKEGVEDALEKDFPHFILVGNKRYRFEKDDETKEAIACFNDPMLGGLLDEVHKRLMSATAA